MKNPADLDESTGPSLEVERRARQPHCNSTASDNPRRPDQLRRIALSSGGAAIIAAWPTARRAIVVASSFAAPRNDATVNALPDPLLSERILQAIRQCEGKPAWYDIAISIGADTVEGRSECLNALRLLEKSGVVRSETSNGAIRFWIVARASG
jgi:hypothetical protein